MAPVELVSFARRKRQRHERRCCWPACSAPGARISPDRVVAALVAQSPQLFEQADQRQPLPGRTVRVHRQRTIEFGGPAPKLRPRLDFALVGEVLLRPQDLPYRVARQAEIARDLLDRLALDEPLTPYRPIVSTISIPTACSLKTNRLPDRSIRGSILDADAPRHRVKLARRNTGIEQAEVFCGRRKALSASFDGWRRPTHPCSFSRRA